MDVLSPRERLLRMLSGKEADRAPVICPGGMMNSAIVDVMKSHGNLLPQGHRDAKVMADLALDVQADTGFENIGIPFCMTVEAEALGSRIDFGTLECEPKIAHEIFPSVKEVVYKPESVKLDGCMMYLLCPPPWGRGTIEDGGGGDDFTVGDCIH